MAFQGSSSLGSTCTLNMSEDEKNSSQRRPCASSSVSCLSSSAVAPVAPPSFSAASSTSSCAFRAWISAFSNASLALSRHSSRRHRSSCSYVGFDAAEAAVLALLRATVFPLFLRFDSLRAPRELDDPARLRAGARADMGVGRVVGRVRWA